MVVTLGSDYRRSYSPGQMLFVLDGRSPELCEVREREKQTERLQVQYTNLLLYSF